MNPAFTWGMDWIIWLQEMGGPLLDFFFEAITFLGEEQFMLLFVPVVFWAVDASIGARIGYAYLITAYANPIFKDLFLEPRPYEVDPAVGKITAGGSGMPSGHAQSSVFFWGVLASQVARRWFWGLMAMLMFLIGLSRIYLGAHFPHQVAAGWLAGAVLLVLFLLLGPRVEEWVEKRPLSQQLAVTFGVPVILAIVYPHSDTVASAAVMAGFGSGLVLSRRYVPFSAAGLWWQRIGRLVIGMAVMLGLYLGLSAVFPGEEAGDVAYYGFRFVRYGLLGLWISLGAPLVFARLRLLERPEKALAEII